MQEKRMDFKQKVNLFHRACETHQRCITVLSRNRWGTQALGMPCLLALVLMVLWAAFAQDIFMFGWIGIWLLCLIKRRIEALKLASEIDSRHDGDPVNLGSNHKLAKLVYEPILVGILAFLAFQFYQFQGWRPHGLPYFLAAGVVSLPICEAVRQTIWQRKVQGLIDTKLEQEALVEEFHNRVGR